MDAGYQDDYHHHEIAAEEPGKCSDPRPGKEVRKKTPSTMNEEVCNGNLAQVHENICPNQPPPASSLIVLVIIEGSTRKCLAIFVVLTGPPCSDRYLRYSTFLGVSSRPSRFSMYTDLSAIQNRFWSHSKPYLVPAPSPDTAEKRKRVVLYPRHEHFLSSSLNMTECGER